MEGPITLDTLRAFIGGTLTDHDAPEHPTRITAIEHSDGMLRVIGEAFTWEALDTLVARYGSLSGDRVVLSIQHLACTLVKPR